MNQIKNCRSRRKEAFTTDQKSEVRSQKFRLASLLLFALCAAVAAACTGHGHHVLDFLSLGIAAPPVDVADEIKKGLGEIKEGIDGLRKGAEQMSTAVGKIETDLEGQKSVSQKLEADMNKLRKAVAFRSSQGITGAQKGMVSDDCARHLASTFILQCAKSGKLEMVASQASVRDALLNSARQFMGIEAKAALTTTDIGLPTEYSGELIALVAQFGVIRPAMTRYPIMMGTAKPPRMGTRPAFGSIAMSAAFTELSPNITFASLESHKIGGLVRVPREIEEQSIVPMGQFLARYGAVEFSRAEDTWGFLADGSGTYEQVKGVVQIASDNNKVVQLGATKTAPSDAALADFRQMRLNTNSRVLSTGRYYINATWEQRLRTFKTQADPLLYNQVGPNGRPTLDGYDIIWSEVLAPYSAGVANPGAVIAVFGDLSYWWMGEHLSPRIDTSDQVYFVNDQLGVRFIEEIDFDYMSTEAASALKLAAA